ncbi:MAG: hypothetical protein VXY83_03335 [Pseudomonadota bacterium]|nr:hypothetical protein [Pseudomonadota bacterium]
MQLFMGLVHAVLMMGTLALTYEYYDNLAEGYQLPEIIHTIVYAGVIGVSVVWAIGHALFGAAMGIAAGGVMDGIRMGLILGVGMSIGRLWPYILTFSTGAFFCHAETWVVVASALLGFVCLGINTMVKFFWGNTSGA